MAEVPRIFLTGSHAVGKKSLIQSERYIFHIDSQFKQCFPTDLLCFEAVKMGGIPTLPPHEEIICGGIALAQIPWLIQTKYYTAQLHLLYDKYFQVNPHEFPSKMLENLDALILMFDFSQPESFEEVTKWENFVEEHSPSILLCVGNKVDLCEAADLKSRAQFWSLDHGFEFIECVAIDSTQGDIPVNNLNDEKWGISRILEALQANMWGNMEYTTSARPVGEAIPLIQTDRDCLPEELEDPEESSKEDILISGEPKEAIACQSMHVSNSILSSLAPSIERLASIDMETNKSMVGSINSESHFKDENEIELSANGSSRFDHVCASEQPNGSNQEQEPLESSIEDFDNMLQEIKRIAGQANSLPDEKRREVAANAALQFWQMLGGTLDELEFDELELDGK